MTRKELKDWVVHYMGGNISCKEFTEAVTAYLEGSQTLCERIQFQMHLGICFGCRNYLQQMKHTISTLGQLPSEPIPPQIRDELIQRFRNWKKET